MALLKFKQKKQMDLSKFAFVNLHNTAIFSTGNLEFTCRNSNSGWFDSPDIDWSTVQNNIEIQGKCIPLYNPSEDGWNCIMYQLWTGNSAVLHGIFCVIKPNKQISVATQDNIFITYPTDIEYVDGQAVTVNIYSSGNVRTLKVFYEDALAFEKTYTNSEVTFPTSAAPLKVGGVRFTVSGYGWTGTIDFKKTFVKLDDVLVWGIDS